MQRRTFLSLSFSLAAGGRLAPAFAKGPKMVKIVEFSNSGQRTGVVEVEKVQKPDAEWQKQLTREQFEVTRHEGTERPFTGKYAESHEHGLYRCICCAN